MSFNEKSCSVCNVEPMETQRETLTELMSVANCMGRDALSMAMIINKHLFGDEKGLADGTEHKCYRDVAEEHCDTLRQLCKELQKTIELMGCNQ